MTDRNIFTIEKIKFSKREIDIMSLAIQRMQYKEMAAILDISHNTVRNHINNILRKIHGSCRKDIILFVKNSDYFEFFSFPHKPYSGYTVSGTNIRIKNHLLKNAFLISWFLILLLYIYDFVK